MGASNVLAERSTIGTTRPSIRQASRHGTATTAGFVLAGFIPLSIYLFPWFEGFRFEAACAVAAIALFGIGAARSLFSDRLWIVAGTETFALGAIATGVAYAVGTAAAFIVGV